MKRGKRILATLAAVFCLSIAAPSVLPGAADMRTVEAATTAKISQKKAALYIGQTLKLNLKVSTGSKKKRAKWRWVSSNKAVAAVNKNGTVTAKGKGVANITAEIGKKKYTCTVTVKRRELTAESTSVTMRGSAMVKINYTGDGTLSCESGKIGALYATLGPRNQNDEVVLTLTAARSVSSTVKLKATDITEPLVINVTADMSAQKVQLNSEAETLKIGESFSLEAGVLPADTDDKKVTWTSSNSDVASVSPSNGHVYAKAEGTAVITATCGRVSASCLITVVNPVKITLVQQLPMNLDGYSILSSVRDKKPETSFTVTGFRYKVTTTTQYKDKYQVTLYFDGLKTYDDNRKTGINQCLIGFRFLKNGEVVELSPSKKYATSRGVKTGETFTDAYAVCYMEAGEYTMELQDANKD